MNEQLSNAPPAVLAAWGRLNPREQAFALALPTAASHEAAMLTAGYAPQTARKKAGMFAAKPDILVVVNYLVGSALEAAQDTVERVVKELCNVAFTDPIAIFDEHDNLLPIREWPEDMRRALAGIEVLEEFEGRGKDRKSVGLTKKVKFWDKGMALERIAKVKGYLRPEQHEHTHRIAGLAGLLKEIDGADCGPGPARSRR